MGLIQITTQLALFLDNKPGTLARVCDALSAAKINIYAISTSDTVDHSVVRMVVSDPRRALLLFEEHGALVVESEVLMIEGDNKPGSLARLAHKLSEAGINIEYAYCATPPEAKRGLLVMRVDHAKKALKVLNS
ncbi:MAG TPA: ACT domain-containing protein [Methylomirabilota bacterium]|nr:ACT domain-containing protein [Methylomirabilota bacterium]